MPPEQDPQQSPSASRSNAPQEDSPLKQIRTFQGDVASALERQNESLFSIQQAQRLKQSSGFSVPESGPRDSKKRREMALLVLGSLLFIVLGLGGIWFGYKTYVAKSAAPAIETPASRLIPPQKSVTIDVAGLTRDGLLAKVSNASAGVKEGELEQMILVNGTSSVSTADFLKLLGSQAPGSLVRSFDPVFMLGALGGSRFLVIKLDSFENAFAGMLSWEPAMAADIGPLFATSALLKSNESPSVFKDVVSKNKDVRVLYAPAEPGSTTTAPVLLYSFFDNRMLIVTDSLDTLQALMSRLTTQLLTR